MTLDDAPELMPLAEAAALVGLGRNAYYEAYRRGELPAIRVGRRLLVPRRTLVRWLQGDPAVREAAATLTLAP